MKPFRIFLLTLGIALAGTALFSSCERESVVDGGLGDEYAYNTYAIGEVGSQQLVLDKLTGSIQRIDCSASWLKASECGQSASGHPIITIENTDGQSGEALVTVQVDCGDKAVVTVKHLPYSIGDSSSGANASFVTDWWTSPDVKLEGIANPQKKPWTEEGSAHIPEEIRLQYLPEDGWEMAFSYVNNTSLQGVRMFALYNRWTAQLRVFAYIMDPTGWGNDLLFRTTFGSTMDTVMYPFYHALQYGIPTNRVQGQNLKSNAQIVDGQPQTFMAWVSPYMSDPGKSVTPGWYAFDYDMSGFVPLGKNWLEEGRGARFKIEADTKGNTEISLRGSISGKIDGTFENPRDIQKGGTSALYGVSSFLGAISGMAGSSISGSASYAIALQGNGGFADKLTHLKYWGGFAAQIASFGIGALAESIDPITYDHVPGKMDLNLDATVELSGYLTTTTPNSLMPLSVSRAEIAESNGEDGHFGHGIWGLAEDPVVYIDKDVILSSSYNVNLVKKGDHLYSNTNIPDYHLRMVSIFDPTSVKVNLNTTDFEGVKKVSVVTTCGVYPDRVKGNTLPYRDMLKLDSPYLDLSGGKTVVRLNSTTSTPRLVVVEPEDLVAHYAADAYETKANSRLWEQPASGSDPTAFRFYGRKMSGAGQSLNSIVDPQVYLPYYKKDNTYILSESVAPDFVVSVQIVFETETNNFVFSKCYIPRIELVDHATAETKIQGIKEYAAKCQQGQPTATLANDTSVPVYNPDGHIFVDKLIHLHDELIK